jgi:nucleotide-binding universal stress UspA family protein
VIFNRLLVPLDGSEESLHALPYAEIIPSRSVRLLTVIQEDDAGLLEYVVQAAEMREMAIEAVKRSLEEAGEGLERQGRNVEQVVETGDAAERILGMAAEVDLIVMTTRGRTGGERLALGSVADRVVRHGTTPVLLVRGGDAPIETGPIQRIIVPLDGSETAEAALEIATALADGLGVPIVLFHGLNTDRMQGAGRFGPAAIPRDVPPLEEYRTATNEYLSELSQRLKNRSLKASIVVSDEPAVPGLQALTRSGDLIVMTTHGRTGLNRWLLGSVAEKVVRHAEVPTLLIRSAPTASAQR